MASRNSYVNPNAKAALEKMKYEVASEVAVKNLFLFNFNKKYFFYTHQLATNYLFKKINSIFLNSLFHYSASTKDCFILYYFFFVCNTI